MNKEELLKEIMELPKIETNNPISAMNGINVDDLMSAIDRLNKIPDYNDLLKENQELKKQLEERNIEYFKGAYDTHDKYYTQQKEFIKWLENLIKQNETVVEVSKYGLPKNCSKLLIDFYKEILQKYKEIIGDIDEKEN